jgi:hypothetical protein
MIHSFFSSSVEVFFRVTNVKFLPVDEQPRFHFRKLKGLDTLYQPYSSPETKRIPNSNFWLGARLIHGFYC